MAIVTRYFAPTAAGSGDGTSWDNRAALFTGGNWSSIIKTFDFTTNTLLCLIGPGTYGCTDTLGDDSFTNAPRVDHPLILHGCDANGVPLVPSNPSWRSSQPVDWDTSLPHIQGLDWRIVINASWFVARLLKFTASSLTNWVVSGGMLDWTVVENSTSHAAAYAVGYTSNVSNSAMKCSGTAYEAVYVAHMGLRYNVRLEGNPAASGGNRHGWSNIDVVNNKIFIGCTAINNPGCGFRDETATAGYYVRLIGCVAANNGSDGIRFSSYAGQEQHQLVIGCMVTGNGGYGINAQGAAKVIAIHNRLRDNTSGAFNGIIDLPTDLANLLTDSDDATEYVDAANGDYRIKAGSPIHGMGYGAGDEIPAGGSAGGWIIG